MHTPSRWKIFTVLALLAGTSAPAATDPALEPTSVARADERTYGPAQRFFQGIPGLARAPGGRLWATWYSGGTDEGPENYVVLVTSGDDGNTWSPIKFVIDPPGQVRAYDPVVWVDPQGRLWWFYSQSYRWWDGRAGVWAAITDNPDAADPAWQAPRRIADGIMMQKPTVLKSGDWLLPIAVWSHEPRRDAPAGSNREVPGDYLRWNPETVGTHVYRSTDQGASFSRHGTAKVPNVRFEEHMIVERRDGSLWLLARTNAGISESVSADGGRSWTEGQPSTIPHVPSRFFIRRLASGRLLLVKHNPRMDTAWQMGNVRKVWETRSHLTAYLSEDDGKTWLGGLLLDQRLPSSYPDGAQAPDGTIYIVNDFDRHGAKEVVMSRFTEDDILAGKLVRPASRTGILVNKATGTSDARRP